jgi:hypothetical protein
MLSITTLDSAQASLCQCRLKKKKKKITFISPTPSRSNRFSTSKSRPLGELVSICKTGPYNDIVLSGYIIWSRLILPQISGSPQLYSLFAFSLSLSAIRLRTCSVSGPGVMVCGLDREFSCSLSECFPWGTPPSFY